MSEVTAESGDTEGSGFGFLDGIMGQIDFEALGVKDYKPPSEFPGFVPIEENEYTPTRYEVPGMDYEVIIVGAGWSGILAAIKLKDAGIPKESIIVLDSASDIGGTWEWNRYPGACVDTPSYYYFPMIKRTKFIPSKKYTTQPEIHKYQKTLIKCQELDSRIQLNTLVTELKFRESDSLWEVHTSKSFKDDQIHKAGISGHKMMTARHVIIGCGPIAVPKFSESVADLHKFNGPVIHTARWPRDLDLTGKRVGLIGTGCSAAQIIQEVGKYNYPNVEKLFVFQRTPAWCIPREDEPTPKLLAEQLLKEGNYQMLEDNTRDGETFLFPAINDLKPGGGNSKICDGIRKWIYESVKDKKTADLLVPKIPFFAKRCLVMDDYYTAYNNPKIELIADGGAKRATATGLETPGGKHVEVDVVVSATGFDVFNISVDSVVGRGGLSLHEKWGGANHRGGDTPGNPRTVFGIHVKDFPNLYLMVGPQTLQPVLNVNYVSLAQADYIARIVMKMRENNIPEVDVTKDGEKYWEDICRMENSTKVWNVTKNWYNKEGKLDNAANFWGTFHDYFEYVEEKREQSLLFSTEIGSKL